MVETMSDTSYKIDKETVEAATKNAVEAAFAKYAASIGTTNTGLTEEQVKYIVETALSKYSYSGVTEAQVKAIVNNATTGLSSLSKAQVQSIVDAAQAKNLTLAQVTAAIANAVKDINDKIDDKVIEKNDIDAKFAEVEKNLTASIKDLKDATLTTSDIETLLAKYVSNGEAKGNYDWYNANATTMAIDTDAEKAADQIVALSTMVKGGTSFAGKTIELPATESEKKIDLSKEENFAPLVDFDGTLVGAGAEKTTIISSVEPVFDITEGRNGKTAASYYKTSNGWQKEVVGYGFVASLKEGGVIENLTIELDVNAEDPNAKYVYYGGIVGLLDGGTIKNCKVTGRINAYGTIGGVVGYAKCGVIDGVDVSGLKITSKASSVIANGKEDVIANKTAIGGIAGWAAAGTLEVKNCTLASGTEGYIAEGQKAGLLFGVVSPWKCGESKLEKWAATMVEEGDWMFKGTGADAVIIVTSCTSNGSAITNTATNLNGWEDGSSKSYMPYTIDGKAVTDYAEALEKAIENAKRENS